MSLKSKLQYNIGYLFVFYILIFSSFAALISTTVQLFFEYKQDINAIEKTADQIENSYKYSIVQALWAYDTLILEMQIKGIKNLPDVLYAGIYKDDKMIIETGAGHPNEKYLSYEYDLLYKTTQEELKIGTLKVNISLTAVYQRLIGRVVVILLTQTLKTFFVSIFIFFLFYYIVGRHLKTIADFVESIHFENLDNQLILNRKIRENSELDELGLVESALNTMRQKLADEMTNVQLSKEALRNSEERFELAMQFVNDGIFDWNLETNEIYYSTAWKKMLGYEDNEIKNEFSEWERRISPEDAKVSWSTLNEVLAGKRERFEKEFQMRHKDGHLVDILSRANVIFNEKGKGIRFVGTHVDITERKKVERELKKTNRLLNAIMNNTTDAIFIKDLQRRYILVNTATSNAIGKPVAEIVGKKDNELFPPESEKIIHEVDSEVLGSGKQILKEEKLETTYGETYWLANKGPYLDEEGKILGLIGISRDITTIKKAEMEKEKLQSQLRQSQKMESIGTLAGGIAHDFNNILGIILGNTELAIDDIPEWNPAKHNLEEVVKASLRAKDVIRQLLSFSRKSESTRKPIQIASVIKDSFHLIRSSLPMTIEIRCDIPDDNSTVLADPTQIHQVIINLCTNAAHAMEMDGGILEIRLRNLILDKGEALQYKDINPGSFVSISVSDTGHGISPEIKERIFDPYFTTKDIGKGTGMGLAMVHGIVKNHNGIISVYSEPGKGSTFKILLPTIGKAEEKQPEKIITLPMGLEKILFIDDEQALVDMGQQILERLGYEVTIQTNPLEALKLFTSQPNLFDLIITDMTMPQMSGDKLTKEILKIRSDMPIILCTGFSEKINKGSSGAIGIRKYLEKPLNKRELSIAIREVLDEK